MDLNYTTVLPSAMVNFTYPTEIMDGMLAYAENENEINEPSERPPPQWISERIAEYLNMYYTPTIMLTGSIGNILSVLVFFKTKLRKLSSSYYLAALGVSDTCFLLITFMHWLNFADVSIYNTNVFCQSFTYFSGVCSFLSVWFVVAFTVERFIAVLYPLKRQTMCTVRRAKMVLCGLTLAGIIINLPLIIFSDVIYNQSINSTMCDVPAEYKVNIIF